MIWSLFKRSCLAATHLAAKTGSVDQFACMKVPVTKKVALGFAGSLVILGIIAATSYITTQKLVESIRAVAQSYRVLGELRDIPNVIKDIQASSRGYVIAGQEVFLEPYYAALDALQPQIQQVTDLTAGKPQQQRRLAEIRKTIDEQIKFTRETVDLRREKGFQAAEARVASGYGQTLVVKITRLVQEMSDAESLLLEERNQLSASYVVVANWVMFLGSALTLAIVAFANLVLRHDIRQREYLERAILAVSDREQQRFGRDLHDSLCQELAGVAFMSEVVERSLATTSPKQALEVGRIAALIRQSVNHARSLARGLQPVEVEANGLMVALEELTKTVREMFHVNCELICNSPMLVSDNAVAVHLYRIAQEAVYNAIRHGQPKTVIIRFEQKDGSGVLDVQDDGKGIPNELPRNKGMGLETMSYRSSVIGAQLAIKRVPTGGTLVRCSFPGQPSKMQASETRTIKAITGTFPNDAAQTGRASLR